MDHEGGDVVALRHALHKVVVAVAEVERRFQQQPAHRHAEVPTPRGDSWGEEEELSGIRKGRPPLGIRRANCPEITLERRLAALSFLFFLVALSRCGVFV